MARSDFPDSAFQPVLLTKEEIEDPYSVLENIFLAFHLPQLREELKELLTAWVIGRFPTKSLTKIERSDMVFLFRKIERLVEAAHLIYEQKSKKP